MKARESIEYTLEERQEKKEKEVILDSSMVEHAAVNRGVVGSSPTRGAK